MVSAPTAQPSPLNADDGLEPVPDVEANRDQYRILGWAMEPGDAVAFNYLTLHGAPPPPVEQPPSRLQLAPRRRRRPLGRPQGRHLAPFRSVKLAHGAVLDAPEFPLLLG